MTITDLESSEVQKRINIKNELLEVSKQQKILLKLYFSYTTVKS